jgi:signal transduction histidine kinase
VLSIAIATMAIQQAQQAVGSQRATVEGLLRDYGSFAAWSYAQQVAEGLATAFHQTLEPVHHDRYRTASGEVKAAGVLLDWQAAGDTDPGCGMVTPGAPYFFRLDPTGTLSFAGEAPPESVRRWLSEPGFREQVSHGARGQETVLSSVLDGVSHHVVASRIGDTGYVFGFALDPERYRRLLRSSFDEKPILPRALIGEHSNDALLVVRIVAGNGEVLYESDSTVPWALVGADTLPARFGGLSVEATVRPAMAGSLIIGGLPRSRLPLLIGLLALALGMALGAVGQMRREHQLASLRSDFVSSVSHELRTPLAQIRLFVETLRLRRFSTEEQREWMLENVDRESVRLSNLVENVLHFSRSERGAMAGTRVRVELEPYLAQIAQGFEPLARARGIRIRLEAEAGTAVELHTDTFRQVVVNLLDNAVKYGPAGQWVRLGCCRVGARVRIEVEDEGPGVDAAERSLIWQPFRRGARAVGSATVGGGIGLAVVRAVVEGHGGTAWVEDGARGGACFVLELAAAPDAAGDRGGPPAQVPPLGAVGGEALQRVG